MLKFDNLAMAWHWIHENYPDIKWDFDDEASYKAGYTVYRDTKEYYNYICSLGDRIELNIKEGNKSINLWINNTKCEDVEGDDAPKITLTIDYTQAILIKGALAMLSSKLNDLDITSGKYENVNASIKCLELIRLLSEN